MPDHLTASVIPMKAKTLAGQPRRARCKMLRIVKAERPPRTTQILFWDRPSSLFRSEAGSRNTSAIQVSG